MAETEINAEQQLGSIASKLKIGEPVPPTTPRTLISWFGSSRRGRRRVLRVEEALTPCGLKTNPPFTDTWIDGTIAFELSVPQTAPKDYTKKFRQKHASSAEDKIPPETERSSGDKQDSLAGYAVRKLKSANTPPISVKPDTPLKTVVTIMMAHDISQVPVMQNEFDLKGVVRWSSIGARLALEKIPATARDCMEPPNQIRAADDVFAVVGSIVQKEYAMVQGDDKRYTGIVTTSDLSEILHIWAEPFLLIGEIENRIRSLIRPKFSLEELRRVAKDETEEIESIEDLAFGHYVWLLQNPDNWTKLQLPLAACGNSHSFRNGSTAPKKERARRATTRRWWAVEGLNTPQVCVDRAILALD